MQSELPEEFYSSTTDAAVQCCKTQSIHPVRCKAQEPSEIHAYTAIHT